ncbi:MaoC family dehydratase N-terminal domain-containing protein [Neobacillus niacini]|uniref:MaoC family dehydratase N-terminal domain-containing protein n=1 Tax=Neobacillus niacini TaxID=86668 RepID=UPI0030024782
MSSTAFKAKKGMKLKPFTFKVEKGKIRELAIAIGDHKEEYLNGEQILPTFPTVVEYWGGGASNAQLLGLSDKKVLFGEQEGV